jgi:tyrosyl-tRNA synthetase
MAEQLRVLRSNAAEIIPEAEFEARLGESVRTGKPLRVKLGLDPTAKDVTLGWAVVLRKLRHFQDMGHTAVLIVGDFTARVGDPSGRSEMRKPLSSEEVDAYAKAVLDQFNLVLSPDRLEVRRNSEWLSGLDMAGILRLTSAYTVARMLERDDFAKRSAAGNPISVTEFLYPLLQGYDSVAVEADVELGGTDQTFNNLVGRVVQERYGQRPQVVMTMPLLVGTDGERKMSQSFGNYIGVTEPPGEMFGKVMSIPDGPMAEYFRLATDLSEHQVAATLDAIEEGKLHPAEAKRRLAWEIVRLYHGVLEADAAREEFDRIHKDRGAPAEIPAAEIPPELVEDGKVWLPKLLVGLELANSTNEGKRLISQGGIRVGGEQVTAEEMPAEALRGRVLQVGRRSFRKLI